MTRGRDARCGIVVACILLLLPSYVSAQHATTSPLAAPHAFDPAALVQDSLPSAWRPLRIAKWSTAALAAGAAVFGFVHNQRADDAFADLERQCQEDPDVCGMRAADGSYENAALEAAYQDVLEHDRRARTGLLAGQVAVAASVVLFILDLRNATSPADIPYEPDRLEIAPARDGGFSVRMSLPVGFGR